MSTNRKSLQISTPNAISAPLLDDCVLDYLRKDKWSNVLMHVCFMQWPRNNHDTITKIAYFMAILLAICSTFSTIGSSIYVMVVSPALRILTGFDVCTSVLMQISAYFALYHFRKRLLEPLNDYDAPFYYDIGPTGLVFFAIFEIIMMVGAVLLISPVESSLALGSFFIMLWVMQWIMCSGLAISMYFVFVDARASNGLIRDLITLADIELLTIEKVIEIRDIVSNKSKKSSFINSLIAGFAVLNSLVLLVAVIFVRIISNSANLQYATETLNFAGGEILTIFALLAKETVYLGIILLEIAKVNDTADDLMYKLTHATWSDDQKELKRLRLFVCLYGEPISYELCGTRPKRSMVLFQIGGYVFSVVLALVQLVFSQQIAEAIGYAI